MKLIPLLMVFAGVVLIYASYIDDDPRNVVFGAINVKRRIKPKTVAVVTPIPLDTGQNGPVVST